MCRNCSEKARYRKNARGLDVPVINAQQMGLSMSLWVLPRQGSECPREG